MSTLPVRGRVRLKSALRSAAKSPSAQSTPGAVGISTRLMPKSSASAQAPKTTGGRGGGLLAEGAGWGGGVRPFFDKEVAGGGPADIEGDDVRDAAGVAQVAGAAHTRRGARQRRQRRRPPDGGAAR